MPESRRPLFEDDDPATLLADFAYVVERMRRDVATGRRTVTDATALLSTAWELLTRLLAPAGPTDPDAPLPLPPSC